MTDFGGGSPTGGLCYLSDGLPEPYRGKLLFSEWGKGGLFVIEVARDGATFRFVKNTPLIQGGNGIDFRPMQLSVASDGSLLIADWQWGGWKGPKTVGTIWRLSWPEAKAAYYLPDENTASVQDLLDTLGHPDRDQRLRAQWALARKGGSMVDGLAALLASEHAPAVARVHALWTLENIMGPQCLDFSKNYTDQKAHLIDGIEKLLIDVGHSADDGIRAQAMRALAYRRTWFDCEVVGELAAHLHADRNPAIRLQAVLAMGRMGYVNLPPLAVKLLGDPDPTVAFGARRSMQRVVMTYGLASHDLDTTLFAKPALTGNEWQVFSRLRLGEPIKMSPTQTLTETWGNQSDILQFMVERLSGKSHTVERVGPTVAGVTFTKNVPIAVTAADRVRAAAVVGELAYQPKPWDGHWWGTQPVKNPPPLPSVAWEGTTAALQALTAALSDPDAEVRLAAAKAFAGFVMPKVEKTGQKGAILSPSPAAPEKTGSIALAQVALSKPPVADGAKIVTAGAAIATDNAKIVTGNAAIVTPDAKIVTSKVAIVSGDTKIAPDAGQISPSTTASAAPVLAPENAGLDAATQALRVLRERLSIETDGPVRRQIIEALGVQKDPAAMEVFREIALGDPDMAFREVAIGAVVNIGGDDAKKTIAQLAGSQLSPAATRKVIQAAGELRVLDAAPALIARLSDEDAGNREAAAKSLAQLGPKSNATDGLIALLGGETDAKVQTAAVEALGSFKDKRALPALLDFSKTKHARRETINAIAALAPDMQALPFLVDALREKSSGDRRNALAALKKMRAEAWPMIEQNLASGRIPAEFAPEIRAAFDSGVIVKWKMIGPFENVWEAVHPPEKDVLAAGWPMTESPTGNLQRHPAADYAKRLLARHYMNAEGKEVGWMDVSASQEEGRVDLEKVFHSNGMVCAYAYADIEAPEVAEAKLLCGSNDQIAVWLNGVKVHDSGPGSRSFAPDQDVVPLHLAGGTNQLLVKIGNVSGGWEFAARIPGLEGNTFTPNKEPAPDAKQRAFALATKTDGSWVNRGDAQRGEKLFHDPTGALGGLCATCHAVRGKGGAVGPDLSAIATNYRRPDLVVSILEPSKTIALGFEQNMIETKTGETFAGALRQETAETFTLIGADAQPHVVKKSDVKSRKPLEISLMPQGITLALKPEDFVDLLAYLETLK